MEEVSALQDIGETGDQGKIHYSVQVVSEGEQGTCRHFSASLRMAVAILAAVAMLVIAVLSYCLILAGELKHSRNTLEEFRTRNEELAKQNGELLAEQEKAARENEELQEKVEILSDTINGKVQQEKEREAEIARTYIPNGFPLKGKATYSEIETELEGNPIAVFYALRGNSVVATAYGTVSSVAGDMRAGYVVKIDHGNGYVTVYRNGARPKVDEGDTVSNTTELFDIEVGNGKLGYQIIENGQYIDPLSFMETSG